MAADGIASSSVSQNQFLQLMVKQLQSQDPLSPTDNGQMLAQLAQFSTLSGMEQLNASFSDMLSLQELTQGSSLIGKGISYTNSQGAVTSGTVNSVAMANGHIALQVNSDSVTLGQIIGVMAGS
jgi:flagellar basal-body rod modification protein FlgD